LHHCDASKGFRAGKDWKYGFIGYGNRMLNIGSAERPQQNDLATLHNRDLKTWNSPLYHLAPQQRLDVVRCRLRECRNMQTQNEKQDRD
jgi:hypothetical protein